MIDRAQKTASCKCCGVFVAEISQIKFGGIGHSVFNYTAEFIECKNCGSCFFLGLDENQIANFYSTDEAGYIGHPQFDSDDVVNKKKYLIYKNFSDLFLNTKLTSLCDIGCGGGGFLLSLLNDKKYNFLVGVDYDVSVLEKRFGHTSIEWLNNSNAIDKTFDVITAFHVLEHIVNLDAFVASLRKLMHEDSTLILEVPNKARYGDSSQGILYWFAIQEHLNHFTPSGLKQLLARQGLEIKACVEYKGLAPNCCYPALLVAAQVKKIPTGDDCSRVLLGEVARCREELKLCAAKTPVTIWGLSQIARQCIANTDKKSLKSLSLIDNGYVGNSFAGIEIEKGRGPKHNSEKLIIFESVSKHLIHREALKYGWKEQQIGVLP